MAPLGLGQKRWGNNFVLWSAPDLQIITLADLCRAGVFLARYANYSQCR